MKSVNHSFQKTVNDFLIRHQSVIDVTSKLQEAVARSNRAVAKAVTRCGCIKIRAEKQHIPSNSTFPEMKKYVNSHIEGELCEMCREILEEELGMSTFYLAALCSLLNLNFNEIIKKELERISTLRIYNLT